jgi:TMEM175 potassium channel family protein
MSYETGLSKNRIEALTDGVFAVVMTLLVLDIGIPQILSNHAAGGAAAIIGAELLKRLLDLWPKILSFGLAS